MADRRNAFPPQCESLQRFVIREVDRRGDWQLECDEGSRGTFMPRILVVDDDPMVCTALKACLARHDFLVTVADGGESGLRSLEDASFDLMIVDIFMPHMRGFESIRLFRERAPF